MSKFIDHITETMLHNRRYKPECLTVAVTRPDDMAAISARVQTQFDIRVSWGRRVFCEPRDLPFIKGNVIRELRHEIYGDMYQQLLDLERAIYSCDRDAALTGIRDLMHEAIGD